MKSIEDSLIRRAIRLLAYLLINARDILDGEKSRQLPFWLRIALRLNVSFKQDQLGLLAAGVAFYFLLAAFPALAALVSLYALFFDPHLMWDQVNLLRQFLPQDALSILTDQVQKISEEQDATISVSLFISLLFTFYVASKGMRVLIKGFNIAYDYEERRNIFWRTLLAYGLTVGMIVYMLFSLIMIAGIPVFIQITPFPETLDLAFVWLRWPLLFGIALVGLEFLYTWGPARKNRRWKICSVGSVMATLMWVAASSLFSLFVTNFANYNQTYGSLSAVVVLLLWFWLSAVMILLGVEINAAFEKEERVANGQSR